MGNNNPQDGKNAQTQNGVPDENSGGEDETRLENAPMENKSDADKSAKQTPKTG